MKKSILLLLIILIPFTFLSSKEKDKKDDKGPWSSKTFSGLKLRSIGPAFTSGRIADFAVNPDDPSEYYVAAASGHIWKTTNAGVTFKPVFDKYGVYSIGSLRMDPNNHNVIWAGTGENNHQRALGYGNGIYKSVDGGASWKNMGLKESRQIGMIQIDPRNSNIVFVAAEGSVWGPGGDRGLYKTTDGGKTWKRVLYISENTGVNNVVFDPRNPDIMYATSEQRRRHVFTKIGGGPESAVYKSEDGGNTWFKIMKGLPKVDIGGMGIAVSPVNPDVVYLIVEAAEGKSGFFRSTNRGASWKKMSDYHSSGQYYNEIFPDPKNVDKVYSTQTRTRYTIDGGKTWKLLGNNKRHVDDHAMWIDPNNTKHFLIGGDGGVYESFDGGKNYSFKTNLPITQFYRVNVDNEYPFYNVYGGTQDNSSFGGPSRTLSKDGIVNSDWFVTNGGDGFWGAVDPKDPNIVYAEAQYGNMVRFDRKSGEAIDIRPEPAKGELTYKWNWNTPLIISPHSNTRIYTAANFVFRSDDRGDNWKKISGDITAQIDRNTWKVMGKYWSIDAVRKDVSTSLYGMAVSLDESPVKENLLYVGTDDGVIQVSEDAKTWRKIDEFPDVPKYTYVSDILASKFDENTVYATFDNTKRDDFKPYVLVSYDKGNNWESISNNLPKNGSVHTIQQDFKNPNLLFVGTEFGIFFSADAGKKWIQLKGGIPDIAVEDIAIQKRENDLVLATFGRGFYILDNYSPLREVADSVFNKEAYIFPVKDALMYIQNRGRYGTGSTYFRAKNPPFGATFSYYLKDVPKTKRQIRREKEKKLFKESKKIPQPSYDELRAEEMEIKPYLIFTIYDDSGNEVRKITKSPSKGINRVTWDLKYNSPNPVKLKKGKYNPTEKSSSGLLAMPGKYSVTMSLYHNGKIKQLAGPVYFNAKVLKNTTLPAKDRAELVAFERKSSELAKTIIGTQKYAEELGKRMQVILQTLNATPKADGNLLLKAESINKKIKDALFKFKGRKAKASREEIPPQPVPLNDRLGVLIYTHWSSTSGITGNQRTAYNVLLDEFPPVYKKIKEIGEVEIVQLQKEMDKLSSTWTPGRLPELKLK